MTCGVRSVWVYWGRGSKEEQSGGWCGAREACAEAAQGEGGRGGGGNTEREGGSAVSGHRHAGGVLRRQPGATRQTARRLRRSGLHRPAVQQQPQLRGVLGRDAPTQPPPKEKRSFEDRHASTPPRAYIDSMRPRGGGRQLARVLLKGCWFYYRCDWHAFN